jgi:hypothetical protein
MSERMTTKVSFLFYLPFFSNGKVLSTENVNMLRRLRCSHGCFGGGGWSRPVGGECLLAWARVWREASVYAPGAWGAWFRAECLWMRIGLWWGCAAARKGLGETVTRRAAL